jgi:hypothetical protein
LFSDNQGFHYWPKYLGTCWVPDLVWSIKDGFERHIQIEAPDLAFRKKNIRGHDIRVWKSRIIKHY